MVEKSIPFSGKTVGDAGPYSADEWARIWRTLFSGILRNDASVIVNTGNGVDDALYVEQTSPASTQIQVNIGAALVKGYWYESDAIETLQIPANGDASGDDRIDLCILRLDLVNQQIRLAILEGTVAPVPAPPALTQNATIWEVQIAEIFVDNGVGIGTNVLDADIDNTVRDYAHLWHWKQGGTNQESYSNRAKLMGQADNSLDVELLSDASVIFNGTGATLAAGSWQTLECAEEYDPDSLISVSSNQITFAKAGIYTPLGHINWNAVSATSNIGLRVRDISNGVTLTVMPPSLVGITAGAIGRLVFTGKPFVIPADNTIVEIQVFSQTSTGRQINDSAPSGTGETLLAMRTVFRRWG